MTSTSVCEGWSGMFWVWKESIVYHTAVIHIYLYRTFKDCVCTYKIRYTVAYSPFRLDGFWQIAYCSYLRSNPHTDAKIKKMTKCMVILMTILIIRFIFY